MTLTLSKFLASGVGSGARQVRPAGHSPLQGPAFGLKGSTANIDKVGVTLMLFRSGIPLSVSFDATNAVALNKPVNLRLPEGVELGDLCARLTAAGVIVE
jgi:hypothetical protein